MSIVEPCVLELLKHADSRYTLVVEARLSAAASPCWTMKA